MEKDGPLVGIFLMILSMGFPCYMYEAWMNLAPVSIGRFTSRVLTWDADPKLYTASVAITIFGCICSFIYGYSCVFSKRK